MSIFDLVKAEALVAYWDTLIQDRAPYLGETLFPNSKQLGLTLKWIKGASGLPVVLKPSAFDVKSIPRSRRGFEKLSADMPFFKESTTIDEETRQKLNIALMTENQAYINAIVNDIFKDETGLLEGAAARREQMRMSLLTTGTIVGASNGVAYEYDYGLTEQQKPTAPKSWAVPTTDVMGQIKGWLDEREDLTGVRPSRAICGRAVWNYLLHNEAINKAVYVQGGGNVAMQDSTLASYLMNALAIDVAVYTKRYSVEVGGASYKYVPDDLFILIPEGDLGRTVFGTTPAESDLMTQSINNVKLTDTGVAVCTSMSHDPVQLETIVSQICLPSFEMADKVVIASVNPLEEKAYTASTGVTMISNDFITFASGVFYIPLGLTDFTFQDGATAKKATRATGAWVISNA